MDVIRRALASAGRTDSVSVMAVTKNHPAETVRCVISSGIGLIGENRVTEGGRKIALLGRDSACFHLIGPLHRGEVRQACRDFHSIDSVDRPVILEALIARQALSPVPPVLLEVDTTPGEAKHGFRPEVALLCDTVCRAREQGLEVRGFLTVGPLSGGESASRRSFGLLREIRDRVAGECGAPLCELSMGMSDDYGCAVLEGATTVRLGRCLLGPRP